MRKDSCRKCGITLEITQKCSFCKEPLKYCCKECNFESDEQIHSSCRLIEMHTKQQIAEVA